MFRVFGRDSPVKKNAPRGAMQPLLLTEVRRQGV